MRFIFKESEDKPMDIYSKPGTKVVYAYPDNGYNYECELAKEILVIGNVYEVEKMDTSTGNVYVDEISKMNLVGNVIPHTWYSRIKMPSGKTDLNAIVILAEIIYWYSSTETFDSSTDTVTGYKKKFKADLLQKSYDDFSKKLGLSKRQVKDAIKRLEDNGLIIRHFREVKVGDLYINNVLYIEPIVENIKAITFY